MTDTELTTPEQPQPTLAIMQRPAPDEKSALAPGSYVNAFRAVYGPRHAEVYCFQMPLDIENAPSIQQAIVNGLRAAGANSGAATLEISHPLPAVVKLLIPHEALVQFRDILSDIITKGAQGRAP